MATANRNNLIINIGSSSPKFFEVRPSLQASVNKKKGRLNTGNQLASLNAKRNKLSRPIGRALKVSAKQSKLKTISSIKKISDTKSALKCEKKSILHTNIHSISDSGNNKNSSSINSTGTSKISTHLKNNALSIPITEKKSQKVNINSDNKNKVKNKVSFNSNIDTYPISDKNSEYTFPKPNIKPKRNKESAGYDKGHSKRSVTSALFSKNPDIPVLQKTESIPSTQKVFSTQSFKDVDISPTLTLCMEKLGFTSMTLVQQLSIPLILEGHDALIKSQTGSGKTLSYALPVIHKLMMIEPKMRRQDGLHALIIVPTRELAIQTYQCLENLCKVCVWVVPGYLIGGEKKKTEKARIRKGINVLVATPGRLLDHISTTNVLELNKVQYLVLDEADRMLDMGYEKSVKSILHSLNDVQGADTRQSLLLSATLTSAVEKLAGMSLRSPRVIDVTAGSTLDSLSDSLSDEYLVTPENLTHHFMLVPMKLRLVSLASFIIQKCKFSDENKILVFLTTQDMVDYHTSLFSYVFSSMFGTRKEENLMKGKTWGNDDDDENDESDDEENELESEAEGDIHFMKLHGNMTQPERTAVFKSFQEAESGVLFSTDVASRGLDLPRVHWIVQYNAACNAADYVHRVGRTARADCKGSAVVFVNPSEAGYVSMLGNQGIKFREISMENTLKTLTKSDLYDLKFERPAQTLEVGATRLQDKFENAVMADEDLRYMAVQAYVSFIRSYAAIPKAAREHFCFKLLHLGHCAKSFALRDPPGVLGARGATDSRRREKRSYEEDYDDRKRFKSKPLMQVRKVISEFDSGVDDWDAIKEKRTTGRPNSKFNKFKKKK